MKPDFVKNPSTATYAFILSKYINQKKWGLGLVVNDGEWNVRSFYTVKYCLGYLFFLDPVYRIKWMRAVISYIISSVWWNHKWGHPPDVRKLAVAFPLYIKRCVPPKIIYLNRQTETEFHEWKWWGNVTFNTARFLENCFLFLEFSLITAKVTRPWWRLLTLYEIILQSFHEFYLFAICIHFIFTLYSWKHSS